MSKDLNKVLSAFQGLKKSGAGKWQAICPCHNDTDPSLSITDTGAKILIFCHGGCSTKDVLDSVGLSFSDLGENEKPTFSCFDRILYGKQQKYGEGVTIKDHYDYSDASGRYLYSKIRFEGGSIEGKLIRYYRIDYAADTYESGRGDQPKVLYRLPELIKAIREGFPVSITEGEKDVETLRRFGWTATTAGGSQDWKKEFAPIFKGAKIRLFPDNDEAGRKLAEQIVSDLSDYAYSVKVVRTSEANKGDVSDYLTEEGHDKQSLQELIAEAPVKYASWIRVEKTTLKTNTDLLARVFSKNEHYLICRTPEDESDKIYIYDNGVYKRCNRNDLKTLIRQYHYQGTATINSIDNVLRMLLCDEGHLCSIYDFDQYENIINLKNGLLDLKSWTLKEHTPKYVSKYQYDVEYQPENTICPVFTKYINDLCLDEYGHVDEQKKMQLQEIAGLILSNVYGYRTKKAAFLYSAKGDSGKSQFINLIQKMIGEDKVANIPLVSMRPENRFALDRLSKCRLISVGDQTDATVSDSTTFKQLTGSDSVRVEEKNKASYSVRFTGFMLYGCNALPEFKDDKGDQLFNRLLIIPCTHTITEAERDPAITDRMFKERNAIFNWMLDGLKRLISNGFRFTKSEASEAALQTYRNKVDTVFRFMNESGYVVTDNMKDAISKTEFYQDYVSWCQANEIENVLLKKNLTERMEKYGCVFNRKANLPNGRRGCPAYQRLKKVEHYVSEDNEPYLHGFMYAEEEELPFTEV